MAATYSAIFISSTGNPPVQISFDLFKNNLLLNNYKDTSAFTLKEQDKLLYIVAGDFFYTGSGKWILDGNPDIGKDEKITIDGYTFSEVPKPSTTETAISNSNNASKALPVDNISKNITGKILITKKSGPGEITGVVEQSVNLDSNFNIAKVEFTELQFTEPGDYVLTISSNSPDVGSLELKAKVLPEPQVIPQDREKDEETKPPSGTRPIIAKIDEPSIILKPMSMPKVPGKNAGGNNIITEGLGYTPVINYAGYMISTEDIIRLKLYHDGIIPKIELTFRDSLNIMKENAPQDLTPIELFLSSTSPNIKSIHLNFKIDTMDKGADKAARKFSITGSLYLPELYIQNNNTYEGTSFDVIRQICKELKLGFNSNIDKTNDTMSWKNPNLTPAQFIENIITHSYISDDSFMSGYIDYYYCFNYVDINKEMKRNITNDIGIDTNSTGKIQKQSDQERIIPLILSNDLSFSNSSTYFGDYCTENNSTETSEEEGHRKRIRYYDRTKKAFLEFLIDSQTSDGKKSIILKGPKNDTKYFDKNIKTQFLGKIDTENTHENYSYSVIQNTLNLVTVKKLVLELKLPNPNFCLYKLMKVNCQIMNPSPTPSERTLNFRDSGEYLLWDLDFIWDGKKLYQEAILYRSEMSKKPEEMREDKPAAKPETKQNNENPVISSTASTPVETQPKPNSVYSVGDVFLVTSSTSGEQVSSIYKLTVKEVLDNGIEISAEFEEIT